mmetsp:Transcript_26233/g.46899  ORF Transcript_26233/g.46899 Transcript_26233/m.46899 type:complete len:486 (-) Transcript_26233:729-2186(-)
MDFVHQSDSLPLKSQSTSQGTSLKSITPKGPTTEQALEQHASGNLLSVNEIRYEGNPLPKNAPQTAECIHLPIVSCLDKPWQEEGTYAQVDTHKGNTSGLHDIAGKDLLSIDDHPLTLRYYTQLIDLNCWKRDQVSLIRQRATGYFGINADQVMLIQNQITLEDCDQFNDWDVWVYVRKIVRSYNILTSDGIHLALPAFPKFKVRDLKLELSKVSESCSFEDFCLLHRNSILSDEALLEEVSIGPVEPLVVRPIQTIELKFWIGNDSISLPFKETQTIGEVKKILCREDSRVTSCQLHYKRGFLKDDRTILEYSLQTPCEIKVIQDCPNDFPVLIEFKNRNFALDIKRNDSGINVKVKIKKEGISEASYDSMILLHNFKLIYDLDLICDTIAKDIKNPVIMLIEGKTWVLVKYGNRQYAVGLQSDDLLVDKLAAEVNLKPEDCSFYHKLEKVDRGELLEQGRIEPGDIVSVMIPMNRQNREIIES